MKTLRVTLLASLLVLAISAVTSRAADTVSGNWKWSITTQNGDTFESTAKLKQDSEKVTGTITSRFGEAEISDGVFKTNHVSFKLKRERDGQTFLVKYNGKLAGDAIKGKIEIDRDGNITTRDWEAKRETGKIAGKWNGAVLLPDGNRIEGALAFKQDGDKITGTITRNDYENNLLDVKLNGDEISYTVKRDRDGRTVTSKYKGKLSGDTIKGKVESDWSGDVQTLDFEATRAK